MPPRIHRILQASVIACMAVSCIGPREKLVVIVEDPDGIAPAATSLSIGDGLGEPTLFAVGDDGFPLRVLLTADGSEVRGRITIDAINEGVQGDDTLARATILATFGAHAKKSIVAQLAAVCGSTATLGRRCSLADGTGLGGICTPQGCGPSVCGDGFVDTAAGELCDDHNLDDGDACESDCTPNVCGDGSWYPIAEACDDGNTVSGDGCRGDCGKQERCDDQLVDANEACDDGNEDPNDGCDACGLTDWVPEVILGMHGDGDPLRLDLRGTGGLALDPLGNILVADTGGNRLWRLDAETHVATRLAGTGTAGATVGSPLASATLTPHGIATDPLGNIYYSLQIEHSVFKIDAQGVLTRVAGTGEAGFTGDAVASATLSPLNGPTGLVWIPALGLVIVDTNNHRLRLLDRDNMLHTIAGTGPADITQGQFAGDHGPAVSARLNMPAAVSALTTLGPRALVVVDTGSNRIRVVQVGGDIWTIAGTGAATSSGDGGQATDAALNGPTSVTEEPNGDLVFSEGGSWVIADWNYSVLVAAPGRHSVRRIRKSDQVVELVLGVDEANADLNLPVGVISIDSGSLSVSDRNNLRIIQIDSDGTTSVIAGRGADDAQRESAPAMSAPWFIPAEVVYDHDGSLLITESGGHRIHRLGDDGVLHVIAGGGPVGVLLGSYSGDGGPAADARLHHPTGIATAPPQSADLLYFCDLANNAIRAIDDAGVIRTIAGRGTPGTQLWNGGPAADAWFAEPSALVVDHDGHIIVADFSNHLVGEIDLGAVPPTIDRVAGDGTDVDADQSLAFDQPLVGPVSLAVDGSNNIYVADLSAHKLRYVSRIGPRETWTITTVAGTGEVGYSADGTPAIAAKLGGPIAVAVSPGDAPVFFDVDFNSGAATPGRLRAIVGGKLSTIAGTSKVSDLGDHGPATEAGIWDPMSVSRRPGGGWVFIDQDQVRQIDEFGTITTVAGGMYPGDGSHTRANLHDPWSMVEIRPGTWAVADGFGQRLRLMDIDARSISTAVGYRGGAYVPAGQSSPVAEMGPLWDVTGVVYANRRGSIYFTERSGAVVQKIRARTLDAPNTWTAEVFVGVRDEPGIQNGDLATARLEAPTGLAIDDGQRALYISDYREHTVRVVDLDTELVTLLAGTPYAAGFRGDGGKAQDAFFNQPSAMAFAADGSLYLADSGNHRIRKLALDSGGNISGESLVSTIIGDGLPISNGSGAPASSRSIDTPNGLVFGPHGNLFLTSSTALMVVSVGPDGALGPDDAVHTIYGASPRNRFPEAVTRCLTGLGMGTSDDQLLVLDRCQGWLLRLTRQRMAP